MSDETRDANPSPVPSPAEGGNASEASSQPGVTLSARAALDAAIGGLTAGMAEAGKNLRRNLEAVGLVPASERTNAGQDETVAEMLAIATADPQAAVDGIRAVMRSLVDANARADAAEAKLAESRAVVADARRRRGYAPGDPFAPGTSLERIDAIVERETPREEPFGVKLMNASLAESRRIAAEIAPGPRTLADFVKANTPPDTDPGPDDPHAPYWPAKEAARYLGTHGHVVEHQPGETESGMSSQVAPLAKKSRESRATPTVPPFRSEISWAAHQIVTAACDSAMSAQTANGWVCAARDAAAVLRTVGMVLGPYHERLATQCEALAGECDQVTDQPAVSTSRDTPEADQPDTRTALSGPTAQGIPGEFGSTVDGSHAATSRDTHTEGDPR